jgi:hypothetical protein
MRPSEARMRAGAAFLATRKRTDSGNSSSISTASSSGMTPPAASTLRQPHCGIIQAATKPPSAAPSGKPQNMALVSVARRWSGQYSLIKVTALGIAAPSPRPVTKRSTVNSARVAENADHRHAAPNNITDAVNTPLRPIRSATGPASSAPAARPNRAALSTGASAGRATPHSSRSEGAMNPMAAVSNPSSRTMVKHSAKISH